MLRRALPTRPPARRGQFSLEFMLAIGVGTVILLFASFLNVYNWRSTRVNLALRATESFADTVASKVFEARAMGVNSTVLAVPMEAPVRALRVAKANGTDPTRAVLRFVIEDDELFPGGAFIDRAVLLAPAAVEADGSARFGRGQLVRVWTDREARVRVGAGPG